MLHLKEIQVGMREHSEHKFPLQLRAYTALHPPSIVVVYNYGQ